MQDNFYLEDVFLNKSYRQIVGDMLDNAFCVLRLFISNTLGIEQSISIINLTQVDIKALNCSTMLKEDYEKAMKDLLGSLNYFITYYDRILKTHNKESKLLRTMIFELKQCRNNWAHSKDFTLREVYRIQDTILIIFDELNLDINSEFALKAKYYRNLAAIKLGDEAKQQLQQQIIHHQQRQQQEYLYMQNQQNSYQQS